ncbi:hypothetical protein A4A49_15539 [Nicotiana attenuata]|uniref:Uncharacterized protein n=1 Tax=Nicotiana attenuata TaxID=49451 RepID=A0A314KMZ0_NICAT|nr:hypothetical protein A4A49_15539 [Nicotiana attenuata]
MACNRMRALDHICVFFCILAVTLVNCKTYPPSIEYGCFLLCIDYLQVERGLVHIPQAELENRCRDGIPEFDCEIKRSYDNHEIDDCHDPKRFPSVHSLVR